MQIFPRPSRNNSRILITLLAMLLGAMLHSAHAEALKSSHVYRNNPNISLDIYRPSTAQSAPVLVYVHGGGWRRGTRSAVHSKPAHFNKQGFVFVSLDYRFVPKTTVDGQLHDIDLALGWLRKNIARFGGDAANIHLMGHSAGAHLVSMTATRPQKNARALLASGALRSVISNDTRAYDLPQVASESRGGKLPKILANAFGSDPAFWRKMSPTYQVKAKRPTPAFLVLYSGQGKSTLRVRIAHDFAARLRHAGTQVTLFDGRQYSHRQINKSIGVTQDITRTIDRFLSRHR